MAVALMKVAGLYLRKSSEDERSAEDGKSVERQREHATAFAATMGWRVEPDLIFSDEAISGGEFKHRPALARLLAALETKRFETLIVMDQSRLGRETIRTLALIQAIQDAGVRIYGYLDGRAIAVDSEMGEVESFMKSWADAKVRRDGRQRVRDALVRKARLGHATGQRTYSYRLVRVGDHTEREVDPAQAAVVRRSSRSRPRGTATRGSRTCWRPTTCPDLARAGSGRRTPFAGCCRMSSISGSRCSA